MHAFIFDLDGTLINSLEDIGLACNATLAAHGYPATTCRNTGSW